jgi:haloacetate dehalogenase
MFESFTRTEIKTSGARIVTVRGGEGPPLLLLHGNPFSHLSWHKIAPRLASEFTVVATDLRGYGDSEKPPGGEDHSGYSFRAMAQDQVEVMASLGFERFYAAGHDRGARVLHRMCLDHPKKVARAAILDIIPQHHLLNNVTRQWGTFSWHWFFMIQPYDFPERLMGADPDYFIEKKLAKTKQGLSFFDPAAIAEYKRYFRNPATVHAMCEDYRATMASTSTWTARISPPGARLPVRCCCYGAPPGASAATTSRWRFGRAMRPTFAPARRSLAGTISRTKRRKKLIGSCASSLRRRSRARLEPWRHLGVPGTPSSTFKFCSPSPPAS